MNQHAPISEARQNQQSPHSSRPDAQPPWYRLNRRRILLLTSTAVAFLALVLYGGYWWLDGHFLVSTDDAYVDADSVIVSPKISGYISEVAVDDNQSVHAGQVL